MHVLNPPPCESNGKSTGLDGNNTKCRSDKGCSPRRKKTPSGTMHTHHTAPSTSPGRCRLVSQIFVAGVGRCLKTFWQVVEPSMVQSQAIHLQRALFTIDGPGSLHQNLLDPILLKTVCLANVAPDLRALGILLARGLIEQCATQAMEDVPRMRQSVKGDEATMVEIRRLSLSGTERRKECTQGFLETTKVSAPPAARRPSQALRHFVVNPPLSQLASTVGQVFSTLAQPLRPLCHHTLRISPAPHCVQFLVFIFRETLSQYASRHWLNGRIFVLCPA